MTSAETRALLERWFEEVWNQGKASTIHELFSAEGKAHGWPEPEAVLHGPAAFEEVHRLFTSAFSDIHMTIDDLFVEGGRGAVRWTCTMKHTGNSLGFAATGKSVTLPGASFMVCENGKLIDGWNFLDQTKPLQELQAAAQKLS